MILKQKMCINFSGWKIDPHKFIISIAHKRWNQNNSKQIHLDVYITSPSNEMKKISSNALVGCS